MSAAALLAETGAIEADTTPFSDYESEAGSELSTESLTSSIRQHYYENGRRYHEKSSGKYHLPSDETEQDRLDLAHHLLTLLRDGDLYKAPLKKRGDPATVLDAGTGTGIWALEFGDQHPGSQVIGVDLSPIQPSWTYPNVKFECDDLEKDWTYQPENFNYIHARTLAFSIKDWPRFVAQCFKHSAPGAFIELAEGSLDGISCDDDTYKGSALEKWSTSLSQCLRKSGIDPSRITGDTLKQSLEDAGYINVQVYPVRVPWGPWPKNNATKYIGAVNQLQLQTGMEAYSLMLFTHFGGMTEEEAKKLNADAFKEVETRKVHGYTYVWNVVGQKPE